MNENRRKAGGYIWREEIRSLKENQALIRQHVDKVLTAIKSGAGNSAILGDDLDAIKDLAWQDEVKILEVLNFKEE